MEQTAKQGKRSGWSEYEANLLWETADESQQQGLPLKQVFERIALKTGRRPNSIRNYYYAQVRERKGENAHTARFVPFTEEEVRTLMEHVLRARAQGQSVRSCLQQLADGDHSLMLRYQNKYRSVLKGRPALVREITAQLNAEGIPCTPPEVKERGRDALSDACQRVSSTAQRAGNAELVRACDVLTQLILSASQQSDAERAVRNDRMGVKLDLYRLALTDRTAKMRALSEAAGELVMPIKDFLSKDPTVRTREMEGFLSDLTEHIGALETCITEVETADTEVLTAKA